MVCRFPLNPSWYLRNMSYLKYCGYQLLRCHDLLINMFRTKNKESYVFL